MTDTWPLPTDLTPGDYIIGFGDGEQARAFVTGDGELVVQAAQHTYPGTWLDMTTRTRRDLGWKFTKVEHTLATELGRIDPRTSDGHHSFAELYDYRRVYNAHMFNMLAALGYDVHKSRLHADGTMFPGGWFIVSADLPLVGQVSNHYQLTYWDQFRVPERDRAAEWDGHDPATALARLERLLDIHDYREGLR